MQNFLYNNFTVIELSVGLAAIGVIIASCIQDVIASKRTSKKLNDTIAENHLHFDTINKEAVEKSISKINRRLMLKRKD